MLVIGEDKRDSSPAFQTPDLTEVSDLYAMPFPLSSKPTPAYILRGLDYYLPYAGPPFPPVFGSLYPVLCK